MAPSTFRRVVLPVVVIALSFVAAWRVLSLGMADHFARSDPQRALGWRSDHPVALVGAAERLVDGDPARAAALARAALAANPLEGRAYRVLGQLAEKRGEQAEAVRLQEIATTRSPRDLRTHAWLQRHYLLSGELSKALRHADLTLRVQPQAGDLQYPVLQILAATPRAQAGLAQLLGRQPPWREGFISHLCRNAPDSDAIAGFMTRLRLGPGGLADSELSAWVDRLTRDGRWDQAYLNWVLALPADKRDQLDNVFNGGFEREPSNSGFDWRFGRVPGAYIERLPTSGASGDFALRISFEERRVPFDHVRQLLALPPGRYRLSGRARPEGLRSERGLVWSVQCADDSKQVAASDPITGQSPWKTFSVPFEVPAGRCGGQWLRLGVPARIRAEQRIGGRAWFDDLRIIRDSG